jgi:hypothetical protein
MQQFGAKSIFTKDEGEFISTYIMEARAVSHIRMKNHESILGTFLKNLQVSFLICSGVTVKTATNRPFSTFVA